MIQPHLVHAARFDPPRDRLIRLGEVQPIAGIRKSTIYALMKRGEFPACVQVTPRCVAWSESSVYQWVQDRIAAAENNPASHAAPGAVTPSAARGAAVEGARGNAHG